MRPGRLCKTRPGRAQPTLSDRLGRMASARLGGAEPVLPASIRVRLVRGRRPGPGRARDFLVTRFRRPRDHRMPSVRVAGPGPGPAGSARVPADRRTGSLVRVVARRPCAFRCHATASRVAVRCSDRTSYSCRNPRGAASRVSAASHVSGVGETRCTYRVRGAGGGEAQALQLSAGLEHMAWNAEGPAPECVCVCVCVRVLGISNDKCSW